MLCDIKWELQWYRIVFTSLLIKENFQLILKNDSWLLWEWHEISGILERKTFPLICIGRDPVITSFVPANHLITLSVCSGWDGIRQLNWNEKQKQTLNWTVLNLHPLTIQPTETLKVPRPRRCQTFMTCSDMMTTQHWVLRLDKTRRMSVR